MSNNRQTFDQLFVRSVAKERESDFNHTVCNVFGVASIPLGIFHGPGWFFVTGVAALLHFSRGWFQGGFPKMSTPASRQACDFMLRVRQNGKDRCMLPLACTDSIMYLALSEKCENKADGDGAVIAQNMRFSCASCKRETDSAVIAAWWKAGTAFKPWPNRGEHLRKDGTCAQCGGSDGWFESRM